MRGKSRVYGTLAAGIALFAWQTISNVAIPWHAATVKAFTSNEAAVQAIHVVAPTNGVYASPQGLLAVVSFTPDMADKSKSMGPNMLKQIVIDLFAALLLCVVIERIGVRRKRDAALTLALAGLAAGVIKEMSDWNWYGFATGYAIVNEIDLTIQFALAGLVIAWIYKRGMTGETLAGGAPGVR
jgi:hypothetical protein